jgi:hypothetical protein
VCGGSPSGVGDQAEHLGPRLAAVARQVLVQAGELGAPVHHLLGDRGADAPPADQHALRHQLGDGAAHGGPGQAQPLGQRQLVLEGVTGAERPGVDRGGQLLGQLVVERHRARTVDLDRQAHRHAPMVVTAVHMSQRENVRTTG